MARPPVKLEVGVNGAVVPARDEYGRPGLRFQAPDRSFGPFHLMVGTSTTAFLRAFALARNDWQTWVDAHTGRG